MKSPHLFKSLGLVTLPRHQKIVLDPLAMADGVKLSSTNGFMPMLWRKSYSSSMYCQLYSGCPALSSL